MKMQKVKTSTLSGVALDWAVAKCQHWVVEIDEDEMLVFEGDLDHYAGDYCQPSKDWSLGGPIIEREGITVFSIGDYEWAAAYGSTQYQDDMSVSDTALEAAMRCYVHSMVGDEVEVPIELLS